MIIINIYYRGYLKSCNYSCYYCPFSKKSCTNLELQKDKLYLEKFVDYVLQNNNINKVFFVPYGEALIHNYYAILTSRLLPNVQIAFQTNLSNESVQNLSLITKHQNLVYVWASMHLTQTTKEHFLSNVLKLYTQGFKISVGSVASYEFIKDFFWLKQNLPSDVYFWLNRFDGQKHNYTESQINDFTSIDTNFSFELNYPKCCINDCLGGTTNMFVNAYGDCYPCNINKYKLGNLYNNNLKKPICNNKFCSCYLAYCNRMGFNKFYRL